MRRPGCHLLFLLREIGYHLHILNRDGDATSIFLSKMPMPAPYHAQFAVLSCYSILYYRRYYAHPSTAATSETLMTPLSSLERRDTNSTPEKEMENAIFTFLGKMWMPPAP